MSEVPAQNNIQAAAQNSNSPANANAQTSAPAAMVETPPSAPGKVDDKAVADAGKVAAEQPPKKESAKAVVPEKYELKMPDGSKLDQKHLESVSTYAKAKGLTNEQAQEFLNRESDAVKSLHDAQMAGLQERKTSWKKESELDKEIGGDNFAKNVELGHRVLKHFGADALIPQLEATGFGNHPDVVRLFMKIGKAMGEDTLVMPKSQGGGSKSLAETFYPSQQQQK